MAIADTSLRSNFQGPGNQLGTQTCRGEIHVNEPQQVGTIFPDHPCFLFQNNSGLLHPLIQLDRSGNRNNFRDFRVNRSLQLCCKHCRSKSIRSPALSDAFFIAINADLFSVEHGLVTIWGPPMYDSHHFKLLHYTALIPSMPSLFI